MSDVKVANIVVHGQLVLPLGTLEIHGLDPLTKEDLGEVVAVPVSAGGRLFWYAWLEAHVVGDLPRGHYLLPRASE